MDLNRDGKIDAKDNAIFHNVISQESDNSNSRNHHINTGQNNNSTINTHHVKITPFVRGVLIFVVIILMLMAITGAGLNVVGTMIEIGLIVFFVAQWISN